MRNNSFRQTFYLGLLILIVLSGFLTIVGVNIYNSFSTKHNNTNIEDIMVSTDENLNKVHDTIYLEKLTLKETSKVIRGDKLKSVPNINKKRDTIITILDTLSETSYIR